MRRESIHGQDGRSMRVGAAMSEPPSPLSQLNAQKREENIRLTAVWKEGQHRRKCTESYLAEYRLSVREKVRKREREKTGELSEVTSKSEAMRASEVPLK